MKLKQNQKQGIGLFFAGIGNIFGIISNHLPETYQLPALLIAILLLIAGIILVFKNRTEHA